MPNREDFSPGKLTLFLGSAAVSCSVAIIVAVIVLAAGSLVASLIMGFTTLVIVFPMYVFLGAYMIKLAEALMIWGFPREQPWSAEDRFKYGAIWPAILLYWLTVSVFNRIVSTIYSN